MSIDELQFYTNHIWIHEGKRWVKHNRARKYDTDLYRLEDAADGNGGYEGIVTSRIKFKNLTHPTDGERVLAFLKEKISPEVECNECHTRTSTAGIRITPQGCVRVKMNKTVEGMGYVLFATNPDLGEIVYRWSCPGCGKSCVDSSGPYKLPDYKEGLQ